MSSIINLTLVKSIFIQLIPALRNIFAFMYSVMKSIKRQQIWLMTKITANVLNALALITIGWLSILATNETNTKESLENKIDNLELINDSIRRELEMVRNETITDSL